MLYPKLGGKVESLTIHGDIVIYGDNVTNYALEGGEVTEFNIDGEIIVNVENSQPKLMGEWTLHRAVESIING